MIGTPMTAKQWADALGIDDGTDVVRMLMPFHEIPLVLRPCGDKEKTAAEVALALEALDLSTDKVEIVSAADVLHPLSGLRKQASECVMIGYADGLVRVAARPLKDLVRNALGADFRHNDGLSRLQPTLFAQLRLAVQPCTYLTERVYEGLFTCAYYQIGFLAMGRNDLAAKIAPLTKLFAQGIFPLGLTDDDVFVIAAG